MNIHTKSHQCEVCKKCFVCQSALNIHMRTHSGDKPYVCSICDKTFAHNSTLTKHQATHSDKRKFKCKICPDDRWFKTKGQLSNHMKYHYEPSHQCEICQKYFYRMGDLNRHLKTHTGEKPYVCSTCGGRFAQKSHLQSHQAAHSDERSFKCNICPDERYFKTKSALNRHTKFHYEPKHCCVLCKKKFHTSSGLKAHEKRLHGSEI